MSELASQYEIHPNQVTAWKNHLVSHVNELFEDKRRAKDKEQEALTDELYRQIGQLKVELEWLKKKLPVSVAERRTWIDWLHPGLNITRQAELLGIARAAAYYVSHRSPQDVRLTRGIDEIYTAYPFYGARRIAAELNRRGETTGRKRVPRLMREMGLVALGPKPRPSQAHPEHRMYPYLLRGVKIQRVNQVWGTDITYIRLLEGWLYLVAIMDWFSRYVLAWKVSITLEVDFCVDALEMALQRATPEIFNSEQGSQFTSLAFTERLRQANIRISMDDRGRVFDNIFNERLWRSVNYEEVYLHEYSTVKMATEYLGAYFDLYNHRRLHSALGYVPPAEIYFRG